MAPRTAVSRIPRSLALLLIGAAAAALAVLPVASASADADDVSWTVRTASNELGADRTSFHYTVEPGSSVTDAMVITNRGSTPLALGVYASDGFTTRSGQFDLAVHGAKQKAVGAWVRGTASSVTVEPGQTVEYPFTVAVPENATPGDYAGGIVSTLTEADSSATVNVDRRLGIRIGLRVGGDLRPALSVQDAQLVWAGGTTPFSGGRATLRYTLRNSGNAVLTARQSAELAGPFGWAHASAKRIAAVPELLPGESWTVSVPFDETAPLVWLSGSTSVTPLVTDAAGSTTPIAPVSASAVGWAIPWALVVVLVLLAAAVVAVVLLTRRARAKRAAQEEERVRIAVDAALAESASQRG